MDSIGTASTNRVAGEFGVAYLVLGFVLQSIGYSLDIGGITTENGGGRILFALGMAAVATVLAGAAWRSLGPARRSSLVAAIERERDEAVREIGEEEERQKTAGS